MRKLTAVILMRFLPFDFYLNLFIDSPSLMSRKLGTSVNDVFSSLFCLAVRFMDLGIYFCQK